tara:strand:- start:425 stop:1108 length:684 start_codon:yes stop_codon:yes gene_type:complete
MDIEELSSELSVKLDEMGAPIGIPIALLSLLLFLQGHRRLQIVTLVVGAAIGYILSPEIIPLFSDIGLDLDPLQITGIICLGFGLLLSASVLMSTRLLTSAFIFITFSTGIQTLNNYGFDVERSELWSGVAALVALFSTMGINKILPSLFSAVFAAYGFIIAGLLFTGNQVSTFEPVEVKTFVMMLPLVIFSLFMQKVDVANQEEKELAKDDPDPEVFEAQQHFLEL